MNSPVNPQQQHRLLWKCRSCLSRQFACQHPRFAAAKYHIKNHCPVECHHYSWICRIAVTRRTLLAHAGPVPLCPHSRQVSHHYGFVLVVFHHHPSQVLLELLYYLACWLSTDCELIYVCLHLCMLPMVCPVWCLFLAPCCRLLAQFCSLVHHSHCSQTCSYALHILGSILLLLSTSSQNCIPACSTSHNHIVWMSMTEVV
jgi:hypothetical protein